MACGSIKRAAQLTPVEKNPPVNAGNLRDAGSIPGLGISPGEGNSNPLQYSCLENPTDRGALRATVHMIAKNQTRLKWLHELLLKNKVIWHNKEHGGRKGYFRKGGRKVLSEEVVIKPEGWKRVS